MCCAVQTSGGAWSGSGSGGSPRDADERHVQFDGERAERPDLADPLDDADEERRAQRNM